LTSIGNVTIIAIDGKVPNAAQRSDLSQLPKGNTMSSVRTAPGRAVAVAALLVSALGLTACSAGGQSTAGPTASDKATPGGSGAAGQKCGSVPIKDPAGDADLSSLPEARSAAFNGYPDPVNAAAYTDFEAKTGPFTIGYSDSFSANPWRAQVLRRLKADVAAYKAEGLTKNLQATNSNLDNNLQIQQITSMINDKVDAIIAIPGSPDAFNGVIKQAFDAGIPFITVSSHVTSPYAINVDGNNYLNGAQVAGAIATLIDGKGDMLLIDGIHGSPAAAAMSAGFKAALELCPDITAVGDLDGQWSDATAKTVTLQYLATHTGPVGGVVNAGAMANGILQAFEQSGRELVPMGDINPTQGGLVSLAEKLPDDSAASSVPPEEIADVAFLTAIATLRGQGPKFDTIVGTLGLATGKAAMDAWIDPSWTVDTTDQVPSPPDAPFLPQSELGSFFTAPAALPALP
jgi:ribose transport system substrate-binding protein